VNGAGQAADLVALLLKKRLFSSPAAFTRTLRRHLASVGRSAGALNVDPAWVGARRADILYVDWSDDDALDDAEAAADDAATSAAGHPGPQEQALLGQLAAWVDEYGQDSDAKARALIDYLVSVGKDGDPAGRWNDERVVVFTEYRDTQRWLADLLDRYGLADGGRLELLYGGMDPDERERIKGDFQKPPGLHPVRILPGEHGLAGPASAEPPRVGNFSEQLWGD